MLSQRELRLEGINLRLHIPIQCLIDPHYLYSLRGAQPMDRLSGPL